MAFGFIATGGFLPPGSRAFRDLSKRFGYIIGINSNIITKA